MNICTLDKLPVNSYCKVYDLNCNGNLRRRLLDLGVIENTKIKSVFESPIGADPVAYEIRGSIIALRKGDAKSIHIHTI